MPNPVMLFQSGDLRMTLENHGHGVINEIGSVPESHVLQADEVEWAKALAERYSIQAPVLDIAGKWMDEPVPVKVDVSSDRVHRFIRDPSRPAYVPGHRTTVRIPFSGDKRVFKPGPSSYTLNPPHGRVAKGELQLVVEYPDDRPVDISGRTDDSSGRLSSIWQRRVGMSSTSTPAVEPGATRDQEPPPADRAAPGSR